MKLFGLLSKGFNSNRVFLLRKDNRKQIINLLFGKYLLVTNTVTSGFLMVVGDLISQEIEFQKGTLNKRYNWKRSGLFRLNPF